MLMLHWKKAWEQSGDSCQKIFSIANRKRNPADVDYRNTIVDADGQIAQNVELRYRKMTDADLSATLNPTTYTYDGTAKEPEVLVVYDGQTLTKDTDYTVAYSDNKNAGNAEVTITGIGCIMKQHICSLR